MNNPLFPNSENDEPQSSRQSKPLFPVSEDMKGANPAADMIRHKLRAIYAEEPDPKQELAEIGTIKKPKSKHQHFIEKLSQGGKPLAHIQTEWHNYYIGLPDDEKRDVWQEFYEANAHNAHLPQPAAVHQPKGANLLSPPTHEDKVISSQAKVIFSEPRHTSSPYLTDKRTSADIRNQILRRITANGKLKPKHHLQSLAFGLGLGAFVILIFLFGFFNELIIAPFIQPSRHVSSTPLIVSADSIAPTATPEVIIPKINVQIPVDYSQTSTNESTIETALLNGVVHYPNTVLPGQQGNAAFFGHSSNNIFNPGKYKFAFVLLHELVPGDTFYLTYNGKVYVYQVFDKKIVSPNDVGVLGSIPGKTATATLITCDPPGTSINRLVVSGEQISPDPGKDTAPVASAQTVAQPAVLASNGPTLWSRFWHFFF